MLPKQEKVLGRDKIGLPAMNRNTPASQLCGIKLHCVLTRLIYFVHE